MQRIEANLAKRRGNGNSDFAWENVRITAHCSLKMLSNPDLLPAAAVGFAAGRAGLGAPLALPAVAFGGCGDADSCEAGAETDTRGGSG